MTYKLITLHKSGSGDRADDGENIHIILKKGGKGRDKRGDIWDKWEVISEFSTKDYEKPWLAKEAAWAAYKKLR